MEHSDWINLCIALISLLSAGAAWKAAGSANESTKFSEKQTKLMTQSFKRETRPYLIPRDLNFKTYSRKITNNFDSTASLSSFVQSDLFCTILNVGKGNAFNIFSMVSLDNIEELFGNDLLHNENPGGFFYEYELTLIPSEASNGPSNLHILQSDANSGSTYDNNIRIDNSFHTKDLLLPDEKYDFFVPSHIQILMLDDIVKTQSSGAGSRQRTYIFSLILFYQDYSQLNTEFGLQSKYKITINRIATEISATPYLEFSINYNPLFLDQPCKMPITTN